MKKIDVNISGAANVKQLVSEVPKIDMKQGWEVKKLGDVCEIELGKTPYRGNKSFWDPEKQTTNVWLSIADLLNSQGKIVTDSKEYVSDMGAKLSKNVKKGTLLVSFKLTLGRLAFAGRDLFTNEAIAALTIKNDDILSDQYLYHFLTFFDWDAATKGDVKVKGKTLNKAKLKQIDILLPSLPEQKRIVAILDETFESIAKAKENAENNLKNANEIFESYLQSVFENKGEGWGEMTFGDICDFKNGINFCKNQKNERGILTIDVLNMYSTGLSVDASNLYRVEMKLSDDFLLKNNDILIVRSSVKREGVAWATFFKEQNEPITFCGFIIRGRPKIDVHSKYLVYFLRSPLVRLDLINKSVKSTITNINQQILSNIIIPLPTLNKQERIVTKLDALSTETKKLEAIYTKKLADLEELKKSILQKAFNGELTEASA